MPPKGSKKAAKPAAKKQEPEATEPKSEANGATELEEVEKKEEVVAPTDEPTDEPEKADEPAAPAEETKKTEESAAPAEEPSKDTNGAIEPVRKSTNKKRKAEETTKEPSKASRRSERGATKAQPSTQQMLSFLLSDKALELCRPDDEIKDLEERGNDIRTYSGSELSPFEELLCAIVLSRPISHRLGLRTIRTILNKPYNFNSPKAINAATPENRHQAMFDARTQHKDKTATQIGMVAQAISEKFGKNEEDVSLDKVRDEAGKGWDEERDLLQKEIKGLGKTGLDIFFRRVQWLWPEAYPFVDERTARGVEKLGLPKDPQKLVKAIEDSWGKLEKKRLPKDKEQAKRRAFVVVCERATSADLEGKAEELMEAAASS
ncbi:hypothetical protein B9Z65_9271 [Elsinoe australis]|uniref:Uncharacterized protein n=1 Tax=Elsinoe australis TaxID=40998 RepID=A0A2P7Z105_9PEZI|nr:hypothetical protein B9Z65_9271 [Elsinoe australis]